MDLLYNNSVCNLVYMHDITSLIREGESQKRHATLKSLIKQLLEVIREDPEQFKLGFLSESVQLGFKAFRTIKHAIHSI